MMKTMKRSLLFASLVGCCLFAAWASAQPSFQSSSQPSRQTTPDKLLLKDFRPNSIYNIPQTRVEEARFPVFDMHAHDYARTPAEVDAWVKTMDEVGLEKTIVMVNRSGRVFDEAAARYKKYPARFDLWCGLDYTGYQLEGWSAKACAELEHCKNLGAVGVGELSDKGKGMMGMGAPVEGIGMHLDDPRLDPVLEKCADLGLPVNMHVGEDRWMYEPLDAANDGLMNSYQWHVENKPGILQRDEVIATLFRAVKKHPRTIFVACHFANCCSDLSKLAAMFDQYPNLYADIGARFAETSPIPRFMARFYEKYQDRLLYGTDMNRGAEMYRATFRILETADEHFYLPSMFTYHWPLHGFNLPPEILKKVYHDNAVTVMKRAQQNK